MVVRWEQPGACEQAGQWVSLRLDGELSELEGAGLDRHLERCPSCSALAVELAGIAQSMRGARLVELDQKRPAAAPSRRPARALPRPRVYAAVGTCAAAAALAFAFFGASGGTPASQTALQFQSARQEAQFVRLHELRIEPPFVPVVVTPPRINSRSLI